MTLRRNRKHRGTVAAARQFLSRFAFSVPGPEPRLYPAACDRCRVQQAKARTSRPAGLGTGSFAARERTYVCTGSLHRFCHPSHELLEEHELARMSQFLLIQPSTVPSVVGCPRSTQAEVPTNVVSWRTHSDGGLAAPGPTRNVFLPTATVISSLEPTSHNFSFLDSVDEENRDVCSKKVGSLWQRYNFRAPTKTEVPSPEENRVMQTGGTPSAVPKTLPKSANAPTQPAILAADRSSTGNNLQDELCGFSRYCA